MKGKRRRNYLRLLILATLVINLEITYLGLMGMMRVQTADFGELVFAYEPRLSRLPYYLVSSNYQPNRLIMSQEVKEVVDQEEPWSDRLRIVGEVHVVEQQAIAARAPQTLDGLLTHEYELDNGMTLLFVQADDSAPVETVYAIRRDNMILFFPDLGGSS